MLEQSQIQLICLLSLVNISHVLNICRTYSNVFTTTFTVRYRVGFDDGIRFMAGPHEFHAGREFKRGLHGSMLHRKLAGEGGSTMIDH